MRRPRPRKVSAGGRLTRRGSKVQQIPDDLFDYVTSFIRMQFADYDVDWVLITLPDADGRRRGDEPFDVRTTFESQEEMAAIMTDLSRAMNTQKRDCNRIFHSSHLAAKRRVWKFIAPSYLKFAEVPYQVRKIRRSYVAGRGAARGFAAMLNAIWP
jgi:hypothetical protein